jgi:hypothetical protein
MLIIYFTFSPNTITSDQGSSDTIVSILIIALVTCFSLLVFNLIKVSKLKKEIKYIKGS